MSKKEPKIKIVGVKGADELMNFLQRLQEGDASVLQELEERAEADKPCDNPMCPVCMWRHDRTSDEIGKAVLECVKLLTHEQLVRFSTVLYGAAARAFDECDDPEVGKPLGRAINDINKMMRAENEKFAFATNPGNEGEGAKH